MNNTWTVLLQRAEITTNECRAAVTAARGRVSQLDASLAHIDKLKQDYLDRYNAAQKEVHSIAENISYRRFLDHLHNLRERVLSQLAAAQQDLQTADTTLAVARREQGKMEAMVEREARNVAAVEAKQEQRSMDAAGIRLFNLK